MLQAARPAEVQELVARYLPGLRAVDRLTDEQRDVVRMSRLLGAS